jgi:hypothetical protein
MELSEASFTYSLTTYPDLYALRRAVLAADMTAVHVWALLCERGHSCIFGASAARPQPLPLVAFLWRFCSTFPLLPLAAAMAMAVMSRFVRHCKIYDSIWQEEMDAVFFGLKI